MAKKRKKAARHEEWMWMAVAAGAGMLASSLVRTSLRTGWKSVTGNDAPENPAGRHTTWKEALAFAVVSGVVTGMANVLVQRSAASGWEHWRGELPPGL